MCVFVSNRFYVALVIFSIGSLLSGCVEHKLTETPAPRKNGVYDVGGTGTVSAETYIQLAKVYASSGDFKAADATLAQAIKIEPRSVKARLAFAKSLISQDRLDEALDLIVKVQQLDKESADAQSAIGRVHFARGQTELARQDFEKAVALEPQNSSALNALGVALDTQGRHEEAQALYKKALAITPGLISARNNLGLSLALVGRPADAIPDLRAVAGSRQKQPQILQNLALAYALNGERDKASEIYKDFLTEEDTEENLKSLAKKKNSKTL
jgi:Flp pilus assembly protein TadD